MPCHHCGSEEYRKNGCYQQVQCYVCKRCGRSFTSRGERYAKAVKEQALQMYVNNVGIHKIVRFVGASPAGVLKWIRMDWTLTALFCHHIIGKAHTVPLNGTRAPHVIISLQ